MMKRPLRAMTLTFAAVLAGCGGGGESNDDRATAYLGAPGVAGLNYRTASQSGVTGDHGEFRYYPGETVTFFIGDVVLAQDVPIKRFMTPIDFDPTWEQTIYPGTVVGGLTTHKEQEKQVLNAESNISVNTARFLVSIDFDSDTENGIQIRGSTRTTVESSVNAAGVDFTTDPAIFGNLDDYPESPENLLVAELCLREVCSDLTPLETVAAASVGVNWVNTLNTNIFLREGGHIFLESEHIEANAGDTRTFSVQIRLIDISVGLADLEVKTVDELPDSDGEIPDPPRSVISIIPDPAPESREFSFMITGESGEETEIVVNMRLDGDYRWYQKVMRVTLL
ncbi:ABC-type transport system involved in resistance to organic solvents, permease component [Hahella chejuensis KCTC 2396]|uniref:ABC-type transport system involved in resistance to organic solvents, permease component n=1 Tax=Hahella chejuensis (strain KCTC 2396) TaxID=349521 RepID=Q2SDS9_HAHCH|nr:hypothetical protein [Hahella chejuensis]ABC31195.1 ABC-type transport system involved in resistance to organic solvents, permease component [Hahella chejuensis KCTC 2396]